MLKVLPSSYFLLVFEFFPIQSGLVRNGFYQFSDLVGEPTQFHINRSR